MKMSRQEFLVVSGLEQETLVSWIEEEWLIPDGAQDETSFSQIDLARARLIRDLKEDLGVNDQGVGLILHLIDQLHGVRRILNELHLEGEASRAEDRAG